MNTNEAKLAAIKTAYGEAWEKVKDFVGKDGWIWSIKLHNAGITINAAEYEYQKGAYRPRSLSGMEDNNGWIRVDDKMPGADEKIDVWAYGEMYPCITGEYLKEHENPNITHWKPFKESKPPIY